MHESAASGGARGQRVVLFQAQAVTVRQTKARPGRAARGERPLLGCSGGSQGRAQPGNRSSPGRASAGCRQTRVSSAVLVLPSPCRCGPRASPRPPLPSCDTAGPEPTIPGRAGAGFGAAGRTLLASDGPLQPPPSCGLAPAQAERETERRGVPASRLSAGSAHPFTSPRLRACVLPSVRKSPFGPALTTPLRGWAGRKAKGLKVEGLFSPWGCGSEGLLKLPCGTQESQRCPAFTKAAAGVLRSGSTGLLLLTPFFSLGS